MKGPHLHNRPIIVSAKNYGSPTMLAVHGACVSVFLLHSTGKPLSCYSGGGTSGRKTIRSADAGTTRFWKVKHLKKGF